MLFTPHRREGSRTVDLGLNKYLKYLVRSNKRINGCFTSTLTQWQNARPTKISTEFEQYNFSNTFRKKLNRLMIRWSLDRIKSRTKTDSSPRRSMIMKINLESPWDANIGIPFHPSFWPGVAFPSLHQYVRFPTVNFSHAYLYACARARTPRLLSDLLILLLHTPRVLPFVRLIWTLFFEQRILFRVLPSRCACTFLQRRRHCFPRMFKCFSIWTRIFYLKRG